MYHHSLALRLGIARGKRLSRKLPPYKLVSTRRILSHAECNTVNHRGLWLWRGTEIWPCGCSACDKGLPQILESGQVSPSLGPRLETAKRRQCPNGPNPGPQSRILARIYPYMLWDGTQYPSSEFGMVRDILARNLGWHMIY